jgi:hypothetical protein
VYGGKIKFFLVKKTKRAVTCLTARFVFAAFVYSGQTDIITHKPILGDPFIHGCKTYCVLRKKPRYAARSTQYAIEAALEHSDCLSVNR